MNYPFECELCHHQIVDAEDLIWHGYGNCVEITDEMWKQWQEEAMQEELTRKVKNYELRKDVADFASKMSFTMERKHQERESIKQPHYWMSEYGIQLAVACMRDKADQLATYAEAVEKNVGDLEQNLTRLRMTAVHLANFAMIIAKKGAQEAEKNGRAA